MFLQFEGAWGIHKGRTIKLDIDNFIFFSITNRKPWVEGEYVAYSDIQLVAEGLYYLMEIQLNSGDRITVEFKK